MLISSIALDEFDSCVLYYREKIIMFTKINDRIL